MCGDDLVESDVHDSDGSGSESDDMDDDAIQEMVNYARANGHYSSEINALLSARERAQVEQILMCGYDAGDTLDSDLSEASESEDGMASS
jgi:hypothetical protein